MKYAHLATLDASEGKSCAPGQRWCKHIRDLWLGTFGNRGNGEYRKELRQAVNMIQSYLQAHRLEDSCALLRLDGLYGTGAVLSDLLGLPFVMRCKEYGLLDLPVVQTRLHLPADQQFSLPESLLVRTLYDCSDVPVGTDGQE
jgi:hypothetical protein